MTYFMWPKPVKKNDQSRRYQICLLAILYVALFVAVKAEAQEGKRAFNKSYGISAGWAIVDNINYEPGYVVDHSINLEHFLTYRIGLFRADDIEPLLQGNSSKARIEIDGHYLAIAKSFEVAFLDFSFGGGTAYAETDAYLFGRKTASDTEFTWFVQAQSAYQINSQFSLFGDWKYFDELSGGRFHLAQIGVHIYF